jgi:hypothetical protein
MMNRAVPVADRHASLSQAGEELLLGAPPRRRGAHLTAQPHPGRFDPQRRAALLGFRTRRAPRRGAIRRGSRAQPEPGLGGLASLPHPVKVIPDPRPGAVLAGQRGHDVHMIGAAGISSGLAAIGAAATGGGMAVGAACVIAARAAAAAVGGYLVYRIALWLASRVPPATVAIAPAPDAG